MLETSKGAPWLDGKSFENFWYFSSTDYVIDKADVHENIRVEAFKLCKAVLLNIFQRIFIKNLPIVSLYVTILFSTVIAS